MFLTDVVCLLIVLNLNLHVFEFDQWIGIC